MKYLLKISAIGNDEERNHEINGTIEDVYQYMKENCQVGEVADIYLEKLYQETAIRLDGSVAKLTHQLEW